MSEVPVNAPEPRANPYFRGHEGAEARLRAAFESGRCPHAWLLCGPRGIGKATLAFRFARFVLARGTGDPAQPPLFDAGDVAESDGLSVDSQHPVFRRVASGGHLDLVTVERGPSDRVGQRRSEIVVGDVRAVGAFLRLTPAEGGWRVVVIDSADDMNRNAANALLKVLEEPSPRALLLLVSHNPGRLLPTVRSRCRRLGMRALDDADVGALIERYAPGLGTAEVATLTRLCEGSIGRAVALAEEGGLDLYRELVAILETWPRLDTEALHRLGDRLARRGAENAFRTVGELTRWWLARMIAFGAAPGGREAPRLDGTERAIMARLLAGAGLDRWLEVWEKVNGLLERAEGANLDRKQVVINALLALETAARA
ncbi:MAG TPA: DNA polymerase III subunit delta' [Rhodospirillales bacterium]|jgi:DNA polymerase-3 subunit delta'|nr:DNA polymerase III subunit delta' [Rhodospirillales bacterium]